MTRQQAPARALDRLPSIKAPRVRANLRGSSQNGILLESRGTSTEIRGPALRAIPPRKWSMGTPMLVFPSANSRWMYFRVMEYSHVL